MKRYRLKRENGSHFLGDFEILLYDKPTICNIWVEWFKDEENKDIYDLDYWNIWYNTYDKNGEMKGSLWYESYSTQKEMWDNIESFKEIKEGK